jgi:hypothetical protein
MGILEMQDVQVNNEQVVENWIWNLPAHSHNGNLHTDGKDLYSYSLKIGYTDMWQKFALNYAGNNFVSMTTSKHVGLAKRYADKVIEPKGGD